MRPTDHAQPDVPLRPASAAWARRRSAARWAVLPTAVLTALLARPAHAAAPDGDVIFVRTVEEDRLTGSLRRLSLRDGMVLLAPDDAERAIPAADLVRVEIGQDHERHPVQAVTDGRARIKLAGGDVLFGTITRADGDTIWVECGGLGTVPVLMERIESWTAPGTVPVRAAEAEGPDDVITLANGDVLRGIVTAVDSERFSIETAQGVEQLPCGAVRSVVLAAEPPDPPVGVWATLRSDDGQRLGLSAIVWSGEAIEGETLDGLPLSIRPDALTSIEFSGGRCQWLSQLVPVSFQHIPGMSLGWGWEADRNVVGGPLRIGGRTFEHGLGVHSRSTLIFDLQGTYSEFVTYFGLDDDSGPLAAVDIEVWVDGKRRFEARDVRPGTLGGPVRIPVDGAARLELTVLFGAHADVQDRFDWVDSALIR